MKSTTAFLIGLLFCLIANNTFAEKKGYISRASIAPVMDGIKDAVWSETTSNQIPNLIGGLIDGPADCSASWYGLWDADNLYLLVEVTDDILKNSGPSAPKFWIHDCFELFLDMLNEKNNVETGASTTDDKYQYRFIYGLDNEPIFEKPPVAGVKNVSKATANGYIIEVKMPWATLIGTFPFGDLVIGKSIGAEFQVADLDNNPLEWMPDANLSWNNPTGTNLKLAANFGTLVLVENNLPDITPPSAISDLSGIAKGSIETELSWTAPGDDGLVGLASENEIRYNTSTISESNWASSTKVDSALVAKISGTKQKFVVTGLTGGTSYYFAIKTKDEAGNFSPVSNSVNVITDAADVIKPSPISDLKINTVRPISIEIQWTATGDDANVGKALYYEIRYLNTQITDANWETAVKVQNVPLTETAGTKQSMIIIGLKPLTNYFISIRATDKQKNTSELSNIVSAKTIELLVNSKTSMDQFIGTNAFIDDPLDKMKAVGYIREYHPWNWDEGDIYNGNPKSYPTYPNNKNAFNPSTAAGGNYWFFDDYYKKLKDAGIMVCPAIMGSVAWLNTTHDFGSNNIPVKAGLNRNDAKSYPEHADHMFQYAARYGSTPVADKLLKLADNQPRKSGLNYLRYLENSNEPDRWWGTVDENFTAENLAAMGSADRDGNCGEMGATFGVKNADPNMKLVMGGLAQLDIKYIERIRQWCIANRKDKAFAYDAINVHEYAMNKSPEDSKIKERIQALVDYRDQYLPDLEIWMTEFGWDSGTNTTPFSPPAIGGYSREEIQAQWIIREYLLLSSTGIDRSAQYMLRNVTNNGKVQFETCGLVTEKNQWQPKPSWYYTYTTKNTLKGMYFTGEQASLNSNVQIYTYENVAQDTMVYALWSPTSNGTVVTAYQLGMVNEPKSANLVQLTNGSVNGTVSKLKINRNSIKVDVSERPVFVVSTKNNPLSSVEIRQPDPEVNLFPNPVTDKLTIEMGGFDDKENFSVRIFNLNGLNVFYSNSAQTQLQLDVSSLPPGIYFAEVKTNGQLNLKKFVKY